MCGGGRLINRLFPDGKYLTGYIVRDKTGYYFIESTSGVDFSELSNNLRDIGATYFSFGGTKEKLSDQLNELNDRFELPGYSLAQEILQRKKAA
jgi:hypothetical protein